MEPAHETEEGRGGKVGRIYVMLRSLAFITRIMGANLIIV